MKPTNKETAMGIAVADEENINKYRCNNSKLAILNLCTKHRLHVWAHNQHHGCH
jgi:hypothetical protein